MAVAERIRPPALAPVEEPEPYTQEEFTAYASAYPDLRMELTEKGRLIIMPPPGENQAIKAVSSEAVFSRGVTKTEPG